MRTSGFALALGLVLSAAALCSCGDDGGGGQAAAPEAAVLPAKPAGTTFEVDSAIAGVAPVKVEVLTAGAGNRVAVRGSRVTCHWVGMLTDGKKWKDTKVKGGEQEIFVGLGNVIPGFDKGLEGIRKGDRWRITIPAPLAFGPHGGPHVPANSIVVIEVDVLNVE